MNRTILVADDDEGVRSLLARGLSDGPWTVLAVGDGEAAVQRAREAAPDIILLDVDMPGKDGLQVLRELRADPKTRMIPVVIVTGRPGPSAEIAGLGLGADDFVAKPFALEELKARIKRLLPPGMDGR